MEKEELEKFANPHHLYERLGVDVLSIFIGKNLLPLADPKHGGKLMEEIALLRLELTDRMGYIIPQIRILDPANIEKNEYLILVRGNIVFRKYIDIEKEDALASIIDDLRNICVKNASKIMTKKDILMLMELVKSQDPTLVSDLVPTFLSPIDLKNIFSNLIQENISIKDILYVFELLNDYARFTQDNDILFGKLKDKLTNY